VSRRCSDHHGDQDERCCGAPNHEPVPSEASSHQAKQRLERRPVGWLAAHPVLAEASVGITQATLLLFDLGAAYGGLCDAFATVRRSVTPSLRHPQARHGPIRGGSSRPGRASGGAGADRPGPRAPGCEAPCRGGSTPRRRVPFGRHGRPGPAARQAGWRAVPSRPSARGSGPPGRGATAGAHWRP